MDPNANLEEQLCIAESLLNDPHTDVQALEHEATRLAELVEALNAWIVNGGFLPAHWEKP